MNVEDLMSMEVCSVRPEASLKEVAALMTEHGVGGVPVVDEDGRPLGVITTADIVIKERAEPLPAGRRRFLHGGQSKELAAKVSARTAGAAMSAPALTVDPGSPVSLAAQSMLEQGVNRLLVVRRERLIGILTRHDLVRAFARSDREIEQEIREDAARELSWPDAVQVSVHEGEVTLTGDVDSVYDAEALPLIVRHVLGVVSVDSELRGWDPASKRHVAVASHL